MVIEDLQIELRELAEFLEKGCFSHNNTEAQRNLVIELTVLKLKALSKE